MFGMKGLLWPVPIASMALFWSLSAPASAQQDFYRGKTLSVVVGLAPGGGIDIIARLFSRILAKYIPGSPTVIVQNMPGAAGATSMNYMVQRAPKDGTTIIYDSWTPLEQIIKSPHVTYDYTKMELIGALRSGPFMMFARKDSVPGGISNSAEFVKSGAIVYGGQQPSLILDMHGRLALDLLKLKYKYVSGYKGAAEIRLALDRNEINVTTHGMQGFRSGVEPTLVKAGKAVPLWYFQGRDASGTYVPSRLAGDMPAFQDVFRQVGGTPSGIEWEALELLTDLYGAVSNFVWGPPGMDASALAALRKAFHATMIDEEFVAEQKKLYSFAHEDVDAAEARRIISLIPNAKPELAAFFKKFMNP